LRYKPVDLDVLPLYIALVAASPLILFGLTRARRDIGLARSRLYRAHAGSTGISHPSLRHGIGISNRSPWQLMFVFGAWCGVGGGQADLVFHQSKFALILSIAWTRSRC